LRYDRLRLRVLLGLFQISRGEKVKELVEDIAEVVGDSTDPEDLFVLSMMQGETALVSGDFEAAYEAAMKAAELKSQNPEIPLFLAAHVAIWSRHLERARHVGRLLAELPATGSWTQVMRALNAASIAAMEGRTTEAVAAFMDVNSRMRQMGQSFEAARGAVDATVLLPDRSEIRALVDVARPLLVELRAQPYLDRLDSALADAAADSAAPASAGAATSPLTPAGS
jgi:hypothetical protein